LDEPANSIHAEAGYYGQSSILVAESRVVRDGINSTIQARSNKIIIKGDNKIVIQALKENIQTT